MLDLAELRRAIDAHGPLVRVVVAATRGSAPREAGADMLVWPDGQAGTIGGGALEFAATESARVAIPSREVSEAPSICRDAPLDALSRGQRRGTGPSSPPAPPTMAQPPDWHSLHALGPELGQCCGGSVTLVFERWDSVRIDAVRAGHERPPPDGAEAEDVGVPGAGMVVGGLVYARPTRAPGSARAAAETPQPPEMPLAARRALAAALCEGQPRRSGIHFVDGWVIETIARPARDLWIWGAGHVGRALVDVLAPLQEFDISWLDASRSRFPGDIPDGVTPVPSPKFERLASQAPVGAEHLVLTHSHALDLEICHGLLGRGFARAGLIGSATKRARFGSRLRALGHAQESVDRIACPIGDPSLGKRPQAIAIGVAAELLAPASVRDLRDSRHLGGEGRAEPLPRFARKARHARLAAPQPAQLENTA